MKRSALEILLQKKMTRREFILYLGLVLFALTGLRSVIQTIAEPQRKVKAKRTSSGFGSGAYGA